MKIGTKIVAGSDAGSPNFGPHPSIFKELVAMQENGMSAAQVIRCATLAAAEELGVKDRGVLEEGKNCRHCSSGCQSIGRFTCVYRTFIGGI